MSSPWTQKVNTVIGMLFVGAFGLGTVLTILNVVDLDNPIAEAMAVRMVELEE